MFHMEHIVHVWVHRPVETWGRGEGLAKPKMNTLAGCVNPNFRNRAWKDQGQMEHSHLSHSEKSLMFLNENP